MGGRHELADGGAVEGETDRDLQIAQHPGRDRRQIDDALDQLAVDPGEAGAYGEDSYFLKGTMDQLICSVICRGYQ